MTRYAAIFCWVSVLGAAAWADPSGALVGHREYFRGPGPARQGGVMQIGHVDWGRGVIVAKGIGYARNDDADNHLMAQRAANLVAARNAVLIAARLRLNPKQRVDQLRDGRARVEAGRRGHRLVAARWHGDAERPYPTATLEVVLGGVEGVAAKLAHWQRR